MFKDLSKLEQLTGHRFKDVSLLERAMTHRSWAYEKLPWGPEEEVRQLHNESLEFVGDSVLGLVITEQLFLRHPETSEGGLTLMKHHLVSTETLARIADGLKLGDYLRFGRGEEKTGGRRKQALLADTLEALVAAVFFDGGYVAARVLVNRLFQEELQNTTPRSAIDYKTLLQETLQSDRRAAPAYRVVRTEGPPHQRTFFVEASWDRGVVEGQGNTIPA